MEFACLLVTLGLFTAWKCSLDFSCRTHYDCHFIFYGASAPSEQIELFLNEVHRRPHKNGV